MLVVSCGLNARAKSLQKLYFIINNIIMIYNFWSYLIMIQLLTRIILKFYVSEKSCISRMIVLLYAIIHF